MGFTLLYTRNKSFWCVLIRGIGVRSLMVWFKSLECIDITLLKYKIGHNIFTIAPDFPNALRSNDIITESGIISGRAVKRIIESGSLRVDRNVISGRASHFIQLPTPPRTWILRWLIGKIRQHIWYNAIAIQYRSKSYEAITHACSLANLRDKVSRCAIGKNCRNLRIVARCISSDHDDSCHNR